MRKLCVTLGIMLAMSLFPGNGTASHSTTDNPPYDEVGVFVHARGGALGDAEAEVRLFANSVPSGQNPRGFFDFYGRDVAVFGVRVVCLDATGNTATVAGVVPGGELAGTVVAFTVVDNTTSGGPETVTALEPVAGPAEGACRTPITSAPATVVDDPTGERLVVHDASGNPPSDFVTGGGYARGGSLGEAGADISFTAQSGPAGENARGDFSFFYFDNGTGIFGQVTCLTVTGNTATVAGVVEGGDRVPSGSVVAFTVAVNATSETATGVETVAGSPDSACRAPVASAPGTFLTSQSLLIFDAPAPPEPLVEGKNRAHACKAERTRIGQTAFAEKYGTNRNGRNAFGKCVSEKNR